MMPRSWLRAAIIGALLAMLAGPVSAHAILLESAPEAGGTLPAGHAELRLRFNSRIDAARSRVALRGPNYNDAALPMEDSGRPDVLTCPADLAPGSYTLRWQVLAVDGHITRGTVKFTVPAGTIQAGTIQAGTVQAGGGN